MQVMQCETRKQQIEKHGNAQGVNFSVLKPYAVNKETYRSGRNELDSKTNDLFGSSPLKNLDFTGLFGYH